MEKKEPGAFLFACVQDIRTIKRGMSLDGVWEIKSLHKTKLHPLALLSLLHEMEPRNRSAGACRPETPG